MAYKDTDFMYASARVSVFETKLLTKEKYMQLIDAATEADAVALFADAVTPVYTDRLFRGGKVDSGPEAVRLHAL